MHPLLEQYYQVCGRRIPDVVAPDIEKLSHLEWLQNRQTGVGGSDSGAVYYGQGTFKSSFDVAVSKVTKITKCEEKSPEDKFRLNYGHLVEQLLGDWYAETHNATVFYDRGMYRSPEYPCMLADCDGFAVTSDNEIIGLEFKSTSPHNRGKWRDGVYGEGGMIGYLDYLCQVMHYMHVLDLDRYDIVCDFKQGNADDIVVVTVNRDDAFINSLCEKEAEFWNNRFNIQLPLTLSSFDKAKDTAEVLYELGVQINGFEEIYDDIEALSEQKKSYENNAKTIDEQINAKKAMVLTMMKNDNTNVIYCNGKEARLVETKRITYDTKELKKHPELDCYRKENVSTSLKFSERKI